MPPCQGKAIFVGKGTTCRRLPYLSRRLLAAVTTRMLHSILSMASRSAWFAACCVLLGSAVFAAACSPHPAVDDRDQRPGRSGPAPLHFTSVASAPEWSALFHRTTGWFGADGIFTIPASGVDAHGSAGEATRTLMLFSDTVIGTVEADSLPGGFSMVNNSVAYLQGAEPDSANLTFHVARGPETLFVPETPASNPEEWYWLGDGFVNEGGTTYFFAYRLRKDEGSWRFVGVSLIALPPGSEPPFEEQRQIDTPLFLPAGEDHGMGYFGGAILVNTTAAGAPHPDGYVYVYGNVKDMKGEGQKNLVAARVRPKAFDDFSAWRYWDGTGWNPDVESVAPLTPRISDEMSVTPLADGRFVLTFQLDTIDRTVAMRSASSPVGPFGPVQKVYECPEASRENLELFCYNAKAHPHLSRPGQLLISYNVNSRDFMRDLHEAPHLYRPRFIRVTFADVF